ncbi:hypothetical protein DFH07DRAFT_737507, partial [Mycena maculata]
RLMSRCLLFLKEKGLITPSDKFFTSMPNKLVPLCICGLCTSECDEHNFDGTMKPPTQVRDSYNHAQKMRAAMTYAFGRLCGLGSLPWHESEVSGRMVGNPSVSETVGTYMTSLQRRKVSFFCVYTFPAVLILLQVRAGETATSMKPFYLYLLLPHLAHLCPIHTLAEWLMVSGITYGYLFRKMASGDRVSPQNSHMVGLPLCFKLVN